MVKNNIDLAKTHNESIRKMKETEVSRIKDKMREQISFIEEENGKLEVIGEQIDVLAASITDKPTYKKKLQELQSIDQKLVTKLSQLNKEISFYESHDNCPTCKQGIEHDFKHSTVDGHQVKSKQITDGRDEIANKISECEVRLSAISDVEDEISALNLTASGHRANITLTKNVLNSMKSELQNAEKEVETVDITKIGKLEDDLRAHHTKQEQLHQDRETLGVVGSMLKDGGIKTRIIRQYVPVMNKLINKYLSAMDFFVQFELDDNFEETIKSRFRDVFSYGSFSEGEKLRIDLALLFTWRAVSKLRNSVTTNLLIMDEIMDSSLDNAGTEEFLKIINELTSDSNVFIISHKGDQLYDKFENVIKFEKHKNFSRRAA
jgi:hypothetical protein